VDVEDELLLAIASAPVIGAHCALDLALPSPAQRG
jgi:hypothetical protein